MNTIVLTGNLTRDCDLRYTQSGKAVANFTLAVPDRFNKETTYFIDVVVWNKLAELCAEYLGKGKKAGVVGRLTTRTYETKEGQKRKVTEVVADEVEFLSPKTGGNQQEKPKDDWSDLGREVTLDDIDIGGDDEIPF